MKSVCLLLVLVTAKGLSLAGRDLPWSIWAPFAFFWQDVLVAMAFAAADALLFRRRWIGWVCYGAMTGYAALNVAVVQTLATPLTGPLLHATAGPLADSIRHHVDAANLVRMGTVLALAALLPLALRRFQDWRVPRTAWVGGLAMVALGMVGVARMDTAGLHRNALLALWPTTLPQVETTLESGDWHTSPFAEGPHVDLARFRGAATGRNVVVISLESTGAGHLKPWGAPEDPMPNLTRLAANAIRFENAYCVYPESIKGLFSVLCSRFPAYGMPAEDYANVRTASLARELSTAGYQTALFHSGRFRYLGMEEMLQGRGFHLLMDAGGISGRHQSSFGVDEPATVDTMLRWIDDLPAGERFFLTYLPIAGHHPYASPEVGPFPEETEADRYRNALHYGDRALGQFLDGLRERGLETNTLFVIFGDHGEAFGDHEGNYGHTLFLYESNVRVPMLLAAPGLITGPTVAPQTASLIDVAPTLLDLLGLHAPESFQGRSLLKGPGGMALFFTDYSLGLLGLRDGRWKFIHELNSGRSRLFDLESDPEERTNQAEQHPEHVQAYRDHLLAWAWVQRRAVGRLKAGQRTGVDAPHGNVTGTSVQATF